MTVGEAWRRLGAADWIVKGMTTGFAIRGTPVEAGLPIMPWTRRWPRNVITVEDSQNRVEEEIHRLLALGAIERCHQSDVDCINPLLVIPKSNGNLRICVDLRAVNTQIGPAPAFKMDGIERVLDMLPKGAFMVTMDVRDGYLQLPMNETAKRFLGFRWGAEVFRYVKLPFGLNSAPALFTRVMGVIVRHCREKGMFILAYLDDVILWHEDRSTLVQHRDELERCLRSVGWERAPEKGSWTPSQRVLFLGFEIDSSVNRITVSPDRIRRMKEVTDRCLIANQVPLRWLGQVTGHVISMTRAAPMAKTLLQSLQQTLREEAPAGPVWDTTIALGTRIRGDLMGLRSMIEAWNGASFWRPSTRVWMQTDASVWGWGATLPMMGVTAQGRWADGEGMSSNERELRAIHMGLLCFKKRLQNRRILIQADNVTALAYTRKVTGRSEILYRVARGLCETACALNVSMEFQHIRGEENIIADMLSRNQLGAEWGLRREWFAIAVERWGLPTVDRFATPLNALTPRFCSRGEMEGSQCPDAFLEKWSDLSFCNPPLPLLTRCIRHIWESRCRAIVVVPVWPGQGWWPLMMKLQVGTAVDIGPGRGLVDWTRTRSGFPEIMRKTAWRFQMRMLDGSRL